MPIRFNCTYLGVEKVLLYEKQEVIIGRPDGELSVDLDLSPDHLVSRQHARVWNAEGCCWIADLDSKHGTLVDGEEIKGYGPQRLRGHEMIYIGGTTLRIEMPSYEIEQRLSPASDGTTAHTCRVTSTLDASDSTIITSFGFADFTQRLALLYELPLQLAAQDRLDVLMQIIVERLVQVIPEASRGALLLRERGGDNLLLKAYVAPDQPAVSETLALRVMHEGRGLIWYRGEESSLGSSIIHGEINTGMYAPLLWRGEPLGALCIDNPQSNTTFHEDDLRLMLAVAHYAAMAVAHFQAQDDLRRHAELTARLFGSRYSPRLRARLMRIASSGRLPVGAQQSHVTMLICDVRGSTKLSEKLGAVEFGELLNEYFPPLIDAIHAYDGTLDRVVGDCIVAVFGAPEPDDRQHENAVRAALKMQASVALVSAARMQRDVETCGLGIGIHCGEALAGFIGNVSGLEFTVIGEVPSYTARFCDGAKAGEVLISAEVYERVYRRFVFEKTNVVTKHEGILPAFRLESERSSAGAGHPVDCF